MELIAYLIGLVLAITLHEFAHAWTSHRLGDTTAERQGRLTLNPLAHIDPLMTVALPLLLIVTGSPVVFGAAKPVPFNPWAVRGGKWGAALVALAGPLTNLFIAIFLAFWLRIIPGSLLAYEILGPMIALNIGFFVFNLIPFPPLDGSRVLYAAAPLPLREVMDRIERAGLVAVFLLLFVAWPFLAPTMGRIIRAIVMILLPASTLP